jgi:hypothetical protein
MSMRLTSEQILEKIRRAFAPFHVVAELQDYHRLAFASMAKDEIIGRMKAVGRGSRTPRT